MIKEETTQNNFMSENKELFNILRKNELLHVVVENEVRQTPFGTITFTVEVKNGVVDMKSLNVVKQKRTKYSGNKEEL